MNPFRQIISSDKFMPHGHCYYWDPAILWSHAISDGLIAIAYFLIPIVLLKVFRKRRNTQYSWLMGLFALFIAGCGMTHVMDVVTIWEPAYRLDSIFRCITAFASIGTAVALVKIAPRLLSIPMANQWQLTIDQLSEANQKLVAANQALEELTQQLSERKHFIEQLVATMPNPVYIFDLDKFQTTFITHNILPTLGYAPGEITSLGNEAIRKIIHPEDQDKRARFFKDFAISAQDSQSDSHLRQTEYRALHGDGTYHHFLITGKKFTTLDKADQVIGTIMDITPLKHTEADLKQALVDYTQANEALRITNETLAERNYFIEQVLNLIPNTVYILDVLTYEPTYINKQITDSLGYTPGQITIYGNSLMKQLIHPDDLEKRSQYYRDFATAADGEIRDIELRFRHANGTYHHILLRTVVFHRSREGSPDQILGIALDITDQKQLATQLLESNLLLQKQSKQLATTIEELQAANDELIAANEKLTTVTDYLRVANLENERLAAKTLRLSEQKYLELTDSMQEIFVVLNQELKYTFVNKAAEQFFNQPREAIYGKKSEDLFGPETGQIIEAAHRQVIASGQSQTEVEHFIINGQSTYQKRTIYPTSEGGVFVIRRNITTGMLAESGFRYLTESITDIFFALDHQLHYTYFNHAAEQFTGRTASETLGKSVYEILPAFKGSAFEKLFLQVLTTRQPDSLMQHYTNAKGEFYFMIYVYPTQIGIAVIGRNETERLLLTQKLQEEKHRLELALESGELGLWDWDMITNQVYFNDQGALMLGYQPDQIDPVLNTWQEKIHPDDLPQVNLKLQAHIQNKSSHYQTELRLKTKQDTWKWVLSSGKVISRDENGKALRATGIIMDITKKKQYEEKINKLNEELEVKVQERTAELISVNNELEAFSFSVSHDLQAPLRSISGFSKILLDDYAEVLDANGKENLMIIHQGTQRMRDIIQALLKLSKVTRMPLFKEPVSVTELARQLLTELHHAYPGRKVIWQVADELTAYADQSLLRIVLQNLLGNAWKYTGQKLEARIEVGTTQTPEGEAFFISDNGAGFDMKYAKKLFYPFQRLHSEKEFEGTGVGLATVDRIISKHGGKIWAESVLREGTTFYFSLTAPKS